MAGHVPALGDGLVDGLRGDGGPAAALAALAAVAHCLTYAWFGDEPKVTPLMWISIRARSSTVAIIGLVIVIFAGEARRFIYFDF